MDDHIAIALSTLGRKLMQTWRVKKYRYKVVALAVLFLFFIENCAYGLAIMPASQNPAVKLRIIAELTRRQIHFADTAAEKEMLKANSADCILLEDGRFLADDKINVNDISVARAAINAEIRALLCIIKREDPDRNRAMWELLFRGHQFSPAFIGHLFPKNYLQNSALTGRHYFANYCDCLLARAFEWLVLLEDGLISDKDIPDEEYLFVNKMRFLILSRRKSLFTNEFWVSSERRAIISDAVGRGCPIYESVKNAEEARTHWHESGRHLSSLRDLNQAKLDPLNISQDVLLAISRELPNDISITATNDLAYLRNLPAKKLLHIFDRVMAYIPNNAHIASLINKYLGKIGVMYDDDESKLLLLDRLADALIMSDDPGYAAMDSYNNIAGTLHNDNSRIMAIRKLLDIGAKAAEPAANIQVNTCYYRLVASLAGGNNKMACFAMVKDAMAAAGDRDKLLLARRLYTISCSLADEDHNNEAALQLFEMMSENVENRELVESLAQALASTKTSNEAIKIAALEIMFKMGMAGKYACVYEIIALLLDDNLKIVWLDRLWESTSSLYMLSGMSDRSVTNPYAAIVMSIQDPELKMSVLGKVFSLCDGDDRKIAVLALSNYSSVAATLPDDDSKMECLKKIKCNFTKLTDPTGPWMVSVALPAYGNLGATLRNDDMKKVLLEECSKYMHHRNSEIREDAKYAFGHIAGTVCSDKILIDCLELLLSIFSQHYDDKEDVDWVSTYAIAIAERINDQQARRVLADKLIDMTGKSAPDIGLQIECFGRVAIYEENYFVLAGYISRLQSIIYDRNYSQHVRLNAIFAYLQLIERIRDDSTKWGYIDGLSRVFMDDDEIVARWAFCRAAGIARTLWKEEWRIRFIDLMMSTLKQAKDDRHWPRAEILENIGGFIASLDRDDAKSAYLMDGTLRKLFMSRKRYQMHAIRGIYEEVMQSMLYEKSKAECLESVITLLDDSKVLEDAEICNGVVTTAFNMLRDIMDGETVRAAAIRLIDKVINIRGLSEGRIRQFRQVSGYFKALSLRAQRVSWARVSHDPYGVFNFLLMGLRVINIDGMEDGRTRNIFENVLSGSSPVSEDDIRRNVIQSPGDYIDSVIVISGGRYYRISKSAIEKEVAGHPADDVAALIIEIGQKFMGLWSGPVSYNDALAVIEEAYIRLINPYQVEQLSVQQFHAILNRDVSISGWELISRFAILPMNANDNPAGFISDRTLERYKEYARSGAGIIYSESSNIEDKTYRGGRCLVVNKEHAQSIQDLVTAIKKENNKVKMVFQIGRKIQEEGEADRADHYQAKRAGVEPLYKILPIDNIVDKYAEAAEVVYNAGGDGIELKAAHSSLLLNFLRPANERTDEFGGQTPENRTRIIRKIVEEIRRRIPDERFKVGIRVAIGEEVIDEKTGALLQGCFGTGSATSTTEDLGDVCKILELLHGYGIQIFNISSGKVAKATGDIKLDYGAEVRMSPTYQVTREVDLKDVSSYYFLKYSKTVKDHFRSKGIKDAIIVGAGFSVFRKGISYYSSMAILQDACDVVGLGRQAFIDPDVFDILSGDFPACALCNKCFDYLLHSRFKSPSGCVTYNPNYKALYWILYGKGKMPAEPIRDTTIRDFIPELYHKAPNADKEGIATRIREYNRVALEQGDGFIAFSTHSTESGGTFAYYNYDAELAAHMIKGPISKNMLSGKSYEIKYDVSRLTESQVDVIENYARLLKKMVPTDSEIKLIPFSSAHGSRESLIAVYCSGVNFKGEGHVDVTIEEGELKEYVLRITGLVNIALASASIPAELSKDDISKYRPILQYIKNQYEAITGEQFTIPDSTDAIIKAIRQIVVSLPKSFRRGFEEIEKHNKVAIETLTAA